MNPLCLQDSLGRALSTVGMAAYNALVLLELAGRADTTVAAIRDTLLRPPLNFPAELVVIERALERLIQLRRVERSGDVYRIRGPRGGLVKVRDRSDLGKDWDPGWQGWMVDVPNRGRFWLDDEVK